jgi:hypothetical protein
MELAFAALVALCAGMIWFIIYLQNQLTAAQTVVADLMELVDSIYRKSLEVPERLEEEPAVSKDLPQELAAFAAGFEDPDARTEAEEYMMARVQAGHDADAIAKEFEI